MSWPFTFLFCEFSVDDFVFHWVVGPLLRSVLHTENDSCHAEFVFLLCCLWNMSVRPLLTRHHLSLGLRGSCTLLGGFPPCHVHVRPVLSPFPCNPPEVLVPMRIGPLGELICVPGFSCSLCGGLLTLISTHFLSAELQP